MKCYWSGRKSLGFRTLGQGARGLDKGSRARVGLGELLGLRVGFRAGCTLCQCQGTSKCTSAHVQPLPMSMYELPTRPKPYPIYRCQCWWRQNSCSISTSQNVCLQWDASHTYTNWASHILHFALSGFLFPLRTWCVSSLS